MIKSFQKLQVQLTLHKLIIFQSKTDKIRCQMLLKIIICVTQSRIWASQTYTKVPDGYIVLT